MAAQEIHYASMAQVVEASPEASELTRDTKKLQSIVALQAPVVPSARMANYHRQRQGGAREWANLIKVSVPAVTSNSPPAYTSQFMMPHNFHRDVVSEITLDTHATVSEFDLKIWGFLMYPGTSPSGLLSMLLGLRQGTTAGFL